jgi:hypothetical protein
VNGERGGGHQPTVETWLGNNSFAAKNSAARDADAIHTHSHCPPKLAVLAQIHSARRSIAARRSMLKHFEK